MIVSRRLFWPLLLLIVVAALLGFAALRWSAGKAAASADAAASGLARNHVGLLASELQKFRLLPLVLIEYPDAAEAMQGSADAGHRLDTTLELLAARTDAAALYAIDRNGRTVAASNWRLPTSFVGQNYGFRPYFTDAMQRGASELFALGTVSGRPGLYLARRVDRGGRALGVIVVKVEFDRLEASWARSSGVTYVTDPHGVILVTSVPAWRFRTTSALDPATLADARRTLQFGAGAPARAPLMVDGATATVTGTPIAQRYRIATEPAPLAGARLVHLAPLGPALAAARSQALLWALGIVLVLGTAGALATRAADTRRLQARARAALEEEVARRTAELRDANAQLLVESEERIEADRRFRAAREELAQANRLGSLGQITAGVAHEINQPVAAIRTFAENGTVLLDRDDAVRTRENLTHIVALTERIGAITGELRAFARRKTPATGAPPMGSVVDGMRLLLGERIGGLLTLDLPENIRRTKVVGDRIRLEQILVNLVQNALDAVAGQPEKRVMLSAAHEGDRIAVRVSDNGGGIDPALRDTLFTPFATAKPGGLGLGLAIARDIAREFGGDLVTVGDEGKGAVFLLTLRPA